MKEAVIRLDGGLKSDLNWAQAKESARKHIEDGSRILWQLDLGLFDRLPYPFSHQSQFLSLGLSLSYFISDVWPEFKESSSGLSLYSGPADHRLLFPWDDAQYLNLREWLKKALGTTTAFEEETAIPLRDFDDVVPALLRTTSRGRRLLSFFCRDACVEYLNLLAANIPDEIPLFVHLQCADADEPGFLAQLTTAERYERLTRVLSFDKTTASAKIAVCLPPCDIVRFEAVEGLDDALHYLNDSAIPYKVIPEALLITEWDELDALIVCPKGLGPQGLRKLQGFCAAGGLVVTLGDQQLGVLHEATFDKWRTA